METLEVEPETLSGGGAGVFEGGEGLKIAKILVDQTYQFYVQMPVRTNEKDGTNGNNRHRRKSTYPIAQSPS